MLFMRLLRQEAKPKGAPTDTTNLIKSMRRLLTSGLVLTVNAIVLALFLGLETKSTVEANCPTVSCKRASPIRMPISSLTVVRSRLTHCGVGSS